MVTQTDSIKIAFFDTQPYDSDSFDKIQKDFNFKITYSNNLVWRISAMSPGDHGNFKHWGIIYLEKRTATLVMYAKGWSNRHKDSFHGIQNLNTLLQCIDAHVFLCHQTPAEPSPLPEGVVHRHRHSFRWTLYRVFKLWKPFSKTYMANDKRTTKHKNVEWELVEAY